MLTDERFAKLVAEHGVLLSEEEDLRTLLSTITQAAKQASPPSRVGSIAEYNSHLSNVEQSRRLGEQEAHNVRARLSELAERRRCALQGLSEAGMPQNVWVRFGDRAVLLGRRSGILELTEVLWEAVLKSPEGASVEEVQKLSGEIASYREAGLSAKASSWLFPFLPAFLLMGFVISPTVWMLVYLFIPVSQAVEIGLDVCGLFSIICFIGWLTILLPNGYFSELKQDLSRQWQVSRPLPRPKRR